MLLPIRLICNSQKVRRDGTSLIQIQYCYSAEKKTLLNTEIAIPPGYWNKRNMRISEKLPVSAGDYTALNTRLQKLLRVAEDIVTYALNNQIEDPVNFTKSHFTPDFDPASLTTLNKNRSKRKELDVFDEFDDYIKGKEKQVTDKSVGIFHNVKQLLKCFEAFRKKPITFDCFDIKFYEEFINYLMYHHVHLRRRTTIKGLRLTTIGRTIKQLRVFLRNRMRRKIIPVINLEDFKYISEDSDAIYLTREEIARIYNTDLSNSPALDKSRDLFIVGCLTGLRFSDFSSIQPGDIRNGMLYKKQNKSDHWVVVPLREEARKIFCHKFAGKIPKFNNGEFNKNIKEVARLAAINEPIRFSHKKGTEDVITIKPKHAWVTSHTCRRSFCTNEFLAGTPADLIMKLSGHKSIKDFYRYIRISPEEAGQKIKELWQQRGEMTLIANNEF